MNIGEVINNISDHAIDVTTEINVFKHRLSEDAGIPWDVTDKIINNHIADLECAVAKLRSSFEVSYNPAKTAKFR